VKPDLRLFSTSFGKKEMKRLILPILTLSLAVSGCKFNVESISQSYMTFKDADLDKEEDCQNAKIRNLRHLTFTFEGNTLSYFQPDEILSFICAYDLKGKLVKTYTLSESVGVKYKYYMGRSENDGHPIFEKHDFGKSQNTKESLTP
jgi:hypothetical protein